MVQKELLLIKFGFLVIFVFSFGCSQPKDNKIVNVFEKVNCEQIPNDTIFQNKSTLKLRNGIYYLNSKPYSGFIKNLYQNNILKSIGSYFQGKQHGIIKTFFSNGNLESLRNYRNGIGYGQHLGYWKNGKKKFDFIYFNDKREGIQKQWYESGNKYYELTFNDDRENGMQKAWRENGKIYINYEVKNGVRYGLQKSALCYTLKNEQIK
jgi:antitoxin component YwqK of YwqJK toxin-antitoxin module